MSTKFVLQARQNVIVGSRQYQAGNKLLTPTGRIKTFRAQWKAMDHARSLFANTWQDNLCAVQYSL